MSSSEIQQFFEGKTVLVTGATGFVGKILIEKILRTCEVKKVFVTMRPKKNKSVYERLEDYLDNGVYDRLRNERVDVLKKIAMVGADLRCANLGIDVDERRALVEEVNVVFHTAATLRFDEPLRVAADTNVRGTQEVVKLCQEMKNLTSLVYVSTAYSFCINPELREVFHQPPLKAFELLTIVDALDDAVLDAITPALLGVWPNTYVFTKSIAEDCVRKMGHDLPVAIVRPSIIIGTSEEPVPGWVDNYTGATGVFVGAFLGVIRTLNCNFDKVADLVPVDYVANCLLAAASKVNRDNIEIYNCTTSHENPITWRNCFEYGTRYAEKMPSVMQIWHFFFVPCGNVYFSRILHLLLHVAPAYVVDFFAFCLGKKRQLVKSYEKIGKFLDVLAFFSTRGWVFYNTNTQKLWKSLSEYDRSLYRFDVAALNWDDYFRSFVLGGRLYLVKDPIETIPQDSPIFPSDIQTGATGFMEKLLLEKLLRACRDVKRIYVIVRAKSEENVHERLRKVFESCVVDEVMYSSKVKAERLLQLVEAFDEDELNVLGSWPNTYTFTKAVIEYLIIRKYADLPLGIIRPSIENRWSDTIGGLVALVIGRFLGVLHVVHGRLDRVIDAVPSDYVTNSVIGYSEQKVRFITIMTT
ncbi:hypothetical protein FQR65_LT13470 [Abscondita terminalis]|nr:hypothetical protein FQR65_LT13470 [Abscondita terminalis]